VHPMTTTALLRTETARRTRTPRWSAADLADLLERGVLARDAARLAGRASRLERRAVALQERAEGRRRRLADVASRAGAVRRGAVLVQRAVV
jgi:hypothetical protein